jgi:hemolysin III
MHQTRPQTDREELANALTHGIGALLGLIALVWMGVQGVLAGPNGLTLASTATWALSVVMLFGGSAAYHAVRSPDLKRALQTFDHCAIYVLIAGTYTPFALVALGGAVGWALFLGVWTLAAVGVALETSVAVRWERTSLALYLLAGWLGLFAVVPLFRALPGVALGLIAVGGVIYTAGVWFYRRNGPWDHVVWHGFVLGGAGAHGLAVMAFVG